LCIVAHPRDSINAARLVQLANGRFFYETSTWRRCARHCIEALRKAQERNSLKLETWEVATSMTAVARLITLAILLGFPGQLTPAFARASSFEDKTWDADNIYGLPQEVRSALTRMCGPDLAARRYFAGYYGKSKFLVLHFGRLRCGDHAAICTAGRCLHQVYGKEGDHYHLLKSYYGPDDD
jgi:hypothetical protein